jgi:CheY-like chemotaxis protein
VESRPKRIRVLVADDSRAALVSICAYLEFDGSFEIVGTAGNGLEAVQQAELLLPDLLVTDLSMPHMNGLEVTEQLRSAMPGLRIVVVTELSGPVLHGQCLERGADSFVEKNRIAEDLFREVFRLFPKFEALD